MAHETLRLYSHGVFTPARAGQQPRHDPANGTGHLKRGITRTENDKCKCKPHGTPAACTSTSTAAATTTLNTATANW